MSRRSLPTALAILALAVSHAVSAGGELAAQQNGLPTIARRTQGLERNDGFLPHYFDPQKSALLLEVRDLETPFIYATHISSGAGWPVRRGFGGGGRGLRDVRIVHFERRDRRLLLVQQNTVYRASGIVNPGLDRTLAQELPVAVLSGFDVVAEEEGRVLIDATEFLLRNAHDFARVLRSTGEGSFRPAQDRSALVPERSGAFTDNTELEALLTLVTDNMEGSLLRRSPDHRSLTVRVLHSFVRMPPPGFQSRAFDPRVGLGAMEYWDYDRPPEDGYMTHLGGRWRLEKRDPEAALSEPVEPLVVYLEAGIPQAYREAVRDGVLYWNRALEAAGFRDAIRVLDLPADASPADFRYRAVVLWGPAEFVSMGLGTMHPLTGEGLKALPTLGGSGVPLSSYRLYTVVRAALGPEAPPFQEYLLQRIRWLAAHEFGHVMGVAHNQASPTVLAATAPWLSVTDEGRLVADLSRIFPDEPYPYDRWMMRYAYTEFASEEEEPAGLEAIVQEGLADGLRYVNANARHISPMAAAALHGRDALEMWASDLAVRRVLLASFGEGVLDPGDPPELLFERLVAGYFYHRYGIGAARNMVCGLEFAHAVQGDGQDPPRPVEASAQRRALDAIVETLTPVELAVPEAAIQLIPPRHPGYSPFGLEWQTDQPGFVPIPAFVTIENDPDGAFDPLAWARTLARFVVNSFLRPDRLERCTAQHATDPALPSASQVIAHLVDGTWSTPMPTESMPAALRRVAQRAVLDRLLALAVDDERSPEIRAALLGSLRRLEEELRGHRPIADLQENDHVRLALRDIRRAVE